MSAAAALGDGSNDADIDPVLAGDCEDVAVSAALPPAGAPCADGGAAGDCGGLALSDDDVAVVPLDADDDPDDAEPVCPAEDVVVAGVYVPGSSEDALDGDDEAEPDEAEPADEELVELEPDGGDPDEEAPDDDVDVPGPCVEEVGALDEPVPLVEGGGFDEEPPDVVDDVEKGRGRANPILEIAMLNRRMVRQADNKGRLPQRHAPRDTMAIMGSMPSAQL